MKLGKSLYYSAGIMVGLCLPLLLAGQSAASSGQTVSTLPSQSIGGVSAALLAAHGVFLSPVTPLPPGSGVSATAIASEFSLLAAASAPAVGYFYVTAPGLEGSGPMWVAVGIAPYRSASSSVQNRYSAVTGGRSPAWVIAFYSQRGSCRSRPQ